MAGKTVIILGGGVGGLVTVNELRKRLGREHRVVLVDKEAEHVFSPSFLWLMIGVRRPDKIVRDLAVLEKKSIEVVQGEIEAIDPARKMVRIGGSERVADYVVVSLGANLAPELVPGLAEAGYNLYSLEGATAIRDARKTLTEGRLVVLTARPLYKCPAAPYEAAMLLDYDLRKRKLRDRVSVDIYAAEAKPLAVTGEEFSGAVRHMLRTKDIAYHPQHEITEVEPATRTLHFANGAEVRFDFLVYVPPHVAPPVVQKAGLTNESGWVPVDRHTMETRFPGVYAIGDVTSIPLSVGLPLSKAGTFAHHQAEAVAQTIAASVTGKGEPATFDGEGECFVEVGDGKAGFGSGNFYAEPSPTVKLRQPTRYWHAGKILFEKDWMRRWF